MYKIITASVALTAGLGLGLGTSQARQVSGWGFNFEVNDPSPPISAPRATGPQNFNATVDHPDRYRFERKALSDGNESR